VHFISTAYDDPRAQPLIDELSREYDERYEPNGGVPSSWELRRYPAEVFSPARGGIFLLAIDADEVVAGGAFMREDDSTVEIKRVWTASAHRRRGFARLVMQRLEQEAADAGYSRAVLTTGARQPEAVGLYRSLGYAPLFDLDADLEAIGYLSFEKHLPVTAERA
jgi:GNAT superfamily N-acetyltransferase